MPRRPSISRPQEVRPPCPIRRTGRRHDHRPRRRQPARRRPVTILDGEGNAFEIEAGRPVFLCRCGGSATKPFCDRSHRANGFRSAVRAAPPPPRTPPPADRARRGRRARRSIRRAGRRGPRAAQSPVTEDALRTFIADVLLTLAFVALFLVLFAAAPPGPPAPPPARRGPPRGRRRSDRGASRSPGSWPPRHSSRPRPPGRSPPSAAAPSTGTRASTSSRRRPAGRATEPSPASGTTRPGPPLRRRATRARAALAALQLEEPVRTEAAECAAETAGAIVAADRIPADEFKMLTRAWRKVVGPVGASPRREP